MSPPEPVTLDDPALGRLTLDHALGIYQGQVAWGGQPTRLTLSCDDPHQPGPAMQTARDLLREQARWDGLAKDAAAAQLLALKNDTWLEEGEAALTPEAFIRCMTIRAVEVGDGGPWSLWFDDGGLFWDHLILVRGRLPSGRLTASIEG